MSITKVTFREQWNTILAYAIRSKEKITEHLECASSIGLAWSRTCACIVVVRYIYIWEILVFLCADRFVFGYFPCGFLSWYYSGELTGPEGPFKVSAMIWFLCDNNNFRFSSFTDKVVVGKGGVEGGKGWGVYWTFFVCFCIDNSG
jgi:hypothetical protein